jgi:hypothetical protein
MSSNLDSTQILDKVYDPINEALNVNAVIPPPTGTQAVSGDVQVINTVAVSGSLSINNLPSVQAISGEVSLAPNTEVKVVNTVGVSGSLDINNFPTTQAVSGDITILGTTTVSGEVSLVTGTQVQVSNLPAVQAVSGTLDIGNFPLVQAVSGSLSIDNLPAVQAVSGTLDIGNFPTTQAISGSVTVLNPVTQVGVTGTIDVSNSYVFKNVLVDSANIQAVTGSYFTVDASLAQEVKSIAVYDTIGVPMSLAVGPISSETNVLFLGPGDSGTYPVNISSGSRLSIRSLENNPPATGANIIVRLIG